MEVSVVIPVFDEEDSLRELYSRLAGVLSGLGREYEIIFVDDGSSDSSFEILQDICSRDASVRAIRFRRNFGQTAAFSAGFRYAGGDVIITLDADLQNDPEDIPVLLEKIGEGWDVVSGWRKNRKDKFLTRRLPSILANKLISRITGVRLHDYGCTTKAYRKEIAKNIDLYGQMHRFMPALARWVGADVTEVVVNHHPRKHGRSKYGLFRTVNVILDLITVKFLMSYSTRPIQIFGLVGFGSGAAGLLMFLYAFFERQVYDIPMGNRPVFFLAVLLGIVGVQFISMGLLSELQVRTYHESQDKPVYSVKEVIGRGKKGEEK